MEYVYRLELPPLSEIINDNMTRRISELGDKLVWESGPAENSIKEEYLNWNGIHWTHAALFYKPNKCGDIHIDNDSPAFTTVWGINWVADGEALMEYWSFNDVTDITESTDLKERSKLKGLGKAREFRSTVPPIKSYKMPPGAYLVNAHLPHKAQGFGKRVVISLRSVESYNLTWDEVVSKFQHLIK